MTIEVWPLCPQIGIVESLEWFTDTITCRSAESRQALRLVPRQTFTYKHKLTADLLGRLTRFVRTYPLAQLYLPVWTETSQIVDGVAEAAESLTIPPLIDKTTFTAGRKLLLWESESSYEVCEIQSTGGHTMNLAAPVSRAFTNPCVMPLEVAEFMQPPEVERLASDNASMATARFNIIDAVDLSGRAPAALPVHDGHPLILTPTESDGSVGEQITVEFEELDSDTGLRYRIPSQSFSRRQTTLSWTKQTREAAWNLRLWLFALQGANVPFWLPTWNRDFALAADIAANTTEFEILDIGYRTAYPNASHIIFNLKDGNVRFTKATSCETGLPGRERLHLDGGIGPAIAAASVQRAGWLNLMKLASDRVELKHGYAGTVKMSSDVVEVPE
jgi:hypothetical protein